MPEAYGRRVEEPLHYLYPVLHLIQSCLICYRSAVGVHVAECQEPICFVSHVSPLPTFVSATRSSMWSWTAGKAAVLTGNVAVPPEQVAVPSGPEGVTYQSTRGTRTPSLSSRAQLYMKTAPKGASRNACFMSHALRLGQHPLTRSLYPSTTYTTCRSISQTQKGKSCFAGALDCLQDRSVQLHCPYRRQKGCAAPPARTIPPAVIPRAPPLETFFTPLAQSHHRIAQTMQFASGNPDRVRVVPSSTVCPQSAG